MTRSLSSLEVLIRLRHEQHWQHVERPTDYRINSCAPDESQYALCAASLPDGSRMGKLISELVIQQHHAASTDVRYLPCAVVRYHPDYATGGIFLDITAFEGALPELPDTMRGWEGRHATYLAYTAKPQQLQEFLEIVMNQPVPTESERQVERPSIKLGRH